MKATLRVYAPGEPDLNKSGIGFMDGADALSGFFGAADSIAAFQAALGPIGHSFERVPFEVLERQHFA